MDRFERARSRGRTRRLRWQRACATVGFGMLVIGAGVSSLHTCAFVYGAYAFIIGPAMLLTSILPMTPPRAVSMQLIVPATLIILGCYHGIHLDAVQLHANTIHSYALTMLGVHTVYVLYAWRCRAPRDGRRALFVSTNVYRNAMLCYVPVGIIWGVAIRNDNLPCAIPHPWWLRLISHGGLSVVAIGMSVLMRPQLHDAILAYITRRCEVAFLAGSIADALVTCGDERRTWQTVETRIRDARRTFRGMDIALLTLAHLSPHNSTTTDAYTLSTPAKLGAVDAFISHSWHDDAREKWRMLQLWRGAFKLLNKREPTIWVDKCCVDPTAAHFKSLINYLPIYLSGCRTLVALDGPTYASRLWCVIELYLFDELRLHDSQIEVLTFDAPTLKTVVFDVRGAVCTYAHDTSRLSRVLRAHCHLESFNAWVRVLLKHPNSGGGR